LKAHVAGPPGSVAATPNRLVGVRLPRVDIHADPFYIEAQRLRFFPHGHRRTPEDRRKGRAAIRRYAEVGNDRVSANRVDQKRSQDADHSDEGNTSAAMTSSKDTCYETIELCRAVKASDLWSAIEAAQFGRVINRDEPESPAEEQALGELLVRLDQVIEHWEESALQNKAPLLQTLQEGLAELAELGFSVYWGCVERSVRRPRGQPLSLPVAVIAISRSAAPTRRAALPCVLDVAEERAEDDDETRG
jgi:hypothetical protein